MLILPLFCRLHISSSGLWILSIFLQVEFTLSALQAGDWPQLLGPDRNGVAVEEKLHAKWDKAGPRTIWEAKVGNGFAGIAVAGDRAIAFLREGDEEIVRCYETSSGTVMWQSASPCSYQGGVSSDKGPRCVPLISENQIYTFGVDGRLSCLNLADGTEVWQRDTTNDYRPLEGYFGVGSTPVLLGNKLIVNVGGRDQASIVAFNAEDGTTLWKTFTDAASYSSPVILKTDGATMAVVVTRLNVVGIDPETGDVKFTLPFGARGPTVNGATPTMIGNQIFLSASYNIGSLLIQVDNTTAKEVWRDRDLLATQYATPVSMAPGSSVLFAIDGRQDSGRASASLKCVDVSQKSVLWEESGLDYGSLIRVENEILILTCGGELIRAAASDKEFSEVGRSQVLKPTDSGYRLPALSNGRLFIRDDFTLKCLEAGPTLSKR